MKKKVNDPDFDAASDDYSNDDFESSFKSDSQKFDLSESNKKINANSKLRAKSNPITITNEPAQLLTTSNEDLDVEMLL